MLIIFSYLDLLNTKNQRQLPQFLPAHVVTKKSSLSTRLNYILELNLKTFDSFFLCLSSLKDSNRKLKYNTWNFETQEIFLVFF
jgi:hypothetical protein